VSTSSPSIIIYVSDYTVDESTKTCTLRAGLSFDEAQYLAPLRYAYKGIQTDVESVVKSISTVILRNICDLKRQNRQAGYPCRGNQTIAIDITEEILGTKSRIIELVFSEIEITYRNGILSRKSTGIVPFVLTHGLEYFRQSASREDLEKLLTLDWRKLSVFGHDRVRNSFTGYECRLSSEKVRHFEDLLRRRGLDPKLLDFAGYKFDSANGLHTKLFDTHLPKSITPDLLPPKSKRLYCARYLEFESDSEEVYFRHDDFAALTTWLEERDIRYFDFTRYIPESWTTEYSLLIEIGTTRVKEFKQYIRAPEFYSYSDLEHLIAEAPLQEQKDRLRMAKASVDVFFKENSL
jgi:hypothetical protein